MKVENNTLLVIDRELIEEQIEIWGEVSDRRYLKFENGHLSEKKLDEVLDSLMENLIPFLHDSFAGVEDLRPSLDSKQAISIEDAQ